MSNTLEQIRAEEQREAQIHDQMYAAQRAGDLGVMRPIDWQRFDGAPTGMNAYVTSVQWLGDVRGRRVLDFGCGNGWLSIILAKRGAIVDAFDLSSEAVRTATLRAEANGVSDQCTFRVGSAYEVPFGDGEYDLVIGQSILHHVGEKDTVARELARVLRPGGRAIFMEPLGDSMLLERLRLMVPIESGSPEDPEQWAHQFKFAELAPFRGAFAIRHQEFELFARLQRVGALRRFADRLARIDRAVLDTVPWLRRLAGAIVIELTRK